MRILVFGPTDASASPQYRWAALILKPDGSLWPVHCTAASEEEVRRKAENFIRYTINREKRPKKTAPEPEPQFEEEPI